MVAQVVDEKYGVEKNEGQNGEQRGAWLGYRARAVGLGSGLGLGSGSGLESSTVPARARRSHVAGACLSSNARCMIAARRSASSSRKVQYI